MPRLSSPRPESKLLFVDQQDPFSTRRVPADCPPCPPYFNCNLENFECRQFGTCQQSSGLCECPPGFGGQDCGVPLCGRLELPWPWPSPSPVSADSSGIEESFLGYGSWSGSRLNKIVSRSTDSDNGKLPHYPDVANAAPGGGSYRLPRNDSAECVCDPGWAGINCNVCTRDSACSVPSPDGVRKDFLCDRSGLVVNQNFQMCDITNPKIVDQLESKKPQVTFSCDVRSKKCNFQFWIDQQESFYCGLDECSSKFKAEGNRNTTSYDCLKAKCACIPGTMLCGQAGAVDIGDFLKLSIKGPAQFRTTSTLGGSSLDGSVFSEPAMDNLIAAIFGDRSIFLDCFSGECVWRDHHHTPEYLPPQPGPKINSPTVSVIIATCTLLYVAVALLLWFLSSRSRARARQGGIRLPDDDDVSGHEIEHNLVKLSYHNISFRASGKQVLSDSDGVVYPGEVMAIIGVSGAGKTTLLEILAGKKKHGHCGGNVRVNGELFRDEMRSLMGFVDQDDVMVPTLTVHETIMDSAMLRLPADIKQAAIEQRVEDVERQLGIYHIRDQLIGSGDGREGASSGIGRGISGGEKRRVAIACEMVTSPSILFLDEPTSGLDSYNATNVVESLVDLARNSSRTVILTIHQPRSQIFALFDRVALLAAGRMVYSGPVSLCHSHFEKLGYCCPPGFNLADYLICLTSSSGTSSARGKGNDYGKEPGGKRVGGAGGPGGGDDSSVAADLEGGGGVDNHVLSSAGAAAGGEETSSTTAMKSIPSLSNDDSVPRGGATRTVGLDSRSPSESYSSRHGHGGAEDPDHDTIGAAGGDMTGDDEASSSQVPLPDDPGRASGPLSVNCWDGWRDGRQEVRTDSRGGGGGWGRIRTRGRWRTTRRGREAGGLREEEDQLGAAAADLDHLVASFPASEAGLALRDALGGSVEGDRSGGGGSPEPGPGPGPGAGVEDRVGLANGWWRWWTGTGTGTGTITRAGKRKGTAERRIGFTKQTWILGRRMYRNLCRDPSLFLGHYAVALITSLSLGFLFYGVSADIAGFQNRLGLSFFLLTLFGFGGLSGLPVFWTERAIFVRERAKGYYHPGAYFLARVASDLVPLRVVPPIVTSVIVYSLAGLVPEWARFLVFTTILVLFNLAAAGSSLLLGILSPNPGFANLAGSLLNLFGLLFSGFLLNQDSLHPAALRWIRSLSIYHYAFEALMVNEVVPLTLIDHKYGLDIEVPGAAILSSFGFNSLALLPDTAALALFAALLLAASYAALLFCLLERR